MHALILILRYFGKFSKNYRPQVEVNFPSEINLQQTCGMEMYSSCKSFYLHSAKDEEGGREGRESGSCTTTGGGDRRVDYVKHLREK